MSNALECILDHWCQRCVFLAAFVALIGAGCGEAVIHKKTPQQTDAPTAKELKAAADAWYERRDVIVMPWTRVLPDSLVEQATVSDDRISFPLAVADDIDHIERLDILVSAYSDSPFLSRVTARTQTADAVVFQTEPATLTEVFYKVRSLEAAQEPAPGEVQGELRQRRQAATSDRTQWGSERDLGGGLKQVTKDGISITTTPVAKIDADFEVELEIGRGSDRYPNPDSCPNDENDDGIFNTSSCYDPTDVPPNSNITHCNCPYPSEISCNRNSDCFEGEYCAGGSHCVYEAGFSHLPGHEGPITDEDVYQVRAMSCGEIVAALELVLNDRHCSELMERWYENPSSVTTQGYCTNDDSFFFAEVVQFPTPAQRDWAKRNCTGGLDVFTFDATVTPEVGLKGTEIKLLTSEAVEKELFSTGEKQLASTTIPIGGVPVMFNVTASAGAKVAFTTEGSVRLPLNDLVIGVEFRGGFHYYGNETIADDSRHTYDSPGEEPAGFYSNHYAHDYPRGRVSSQTLLKDANGDGEVGWEDFQSIGFKADLQFETKLSLKIYNAVGAYIKPLVPYAEVSADTGADCTFGSRAGIQGSIGLEASIPLCPSCGGELKLAGWDSCSDYCDSNDPFDGMLCVKNCLSDDCTDPGEVDPNADDPQWVELSVFPEHANQNGSSITPEGFDLDQLVINRNGEIIAPIKVEVDGQSADQFAAALKDAKTFACDSRYRDSEDDYYEQKWNEIGPSFSESLRAKFPKRILADDQIVVRKALSSDGVCKGTGQYISVLLVGEKANTFSSGPFRFSEDSGDLNSAMTTVRVDNCPMDSGGSEKICWEY